MPAFRKLLTTHDLNDGEMRKFSIEGKEILVANLGNNFYAIDDMCTHAEANLSDGELDGDSVECPLHGACFNLKTGAAESDPAEDDVKTYAVKVEGEDVLIEI